MAIGDSILSLLGQRDPRQQLLDSIMQSGQGGVPYAAQPSAPAGTDPTTTGATQQPDPVPEGLKSPPDLASMYGDLIKYNERTSNINRGFGLIGSAISQDGNRDSTLRAFTGDRSEGDNLGVKDIAELGMTMRKNQLALQTRAAMLASLPQIAKQYGITLEAAQAMYNGGQLEEFIKQQEAPDRTTMADAQGQLRTVDQRRGAGIGGPIGPIKSQLKAIDGPDGSKYLFDEANGTLGQQLIAPGTATNDTKNYDAYLSDEITRGTEPGKILSFNDWNLQQKKAGASNTVLKQESAFASQMGTDFAKDYKGIRDAAKNAQDLMGQYDLVQKALDSGLETGATADAVNSARKIGLAMGMDVDQTKISGAELIKSVANQMALTMRNPESGMGMPGSLSDKDISFLKQANVGIDTSTKGNRLLIDTYKRVQQRRIEVAKMANAYVKKNGQLDADFADQVTAYNEANPLFEDLQVDQKDPNNIDSLVEQYKTKRK